MGFGDVFSNTTTQRTDTTTQNAGFSEIVGDATSWNIGRIGKKGSLAITDGGAIMRMADISQSALDLGGYALGAGNQVAIAGLDYARAAYQSSLDLVGNSLDKALAQSSQVAKSSTTGDSERMQQVALWVVGAFVAAWIIPKLPKLRGL